VKIVILSEAKEDGPDYGSFASLRMTKTSLRMTKTSLRMTKTSLRMTKTRSG
jgi:hypothetical protein